jgi:hypothetical protein
MKSSITITVTMKALEFASLVAANLDGRLFVLSHKGVRHGEYVVVQALPNASTCRVLHDGIARPLELMRQEGSIAANEEFKGFIDYLLGICPDPMCANYDGNIGEMMSVVAFLFSTVTTGDGAIETCVTVLKMDYKQCDDQVVAYMNHLFCKYPSSSVRFENRLPQASRLICLIVAPPPELVAICGIPWPNFLKVTDAAQGAREFYLKLSSSAQLGLTRSMLNKDETGPDRFTYSVTAEGGSSEYECCIVYPACRCKSLRKHRKYAPPGDSAE